MSTPEEFVTLVLNNVLIDRNKRTWKKYFIGTVAPTDTNKKYAKIKFVEACISDYSRDIYLEKKIYYIEFPFEDVNEINTDLVTVNNYCSYNGKYQFIIVDIDIVKI